MTVARTQVCVLASSWRVSMKRFFGFAFALFFAVASIALVGGESTAVAGRGCHGARRCHGGLFKKHHRRCHGEQVASDCGSCGEVSSDCGGCGEVSSDCGGCAGGCAGGDCGGEGVIVSEGVPTEAAPNAPKAEGAAPAAPSKT